MIPSREIEIGKRILVSFRNRKDIFEDFKDCAGDKDIEKALHLNYITFISSIDYGGKNIKAEQLWQKGKEWAKDYPWLFKPERILKLSVSKIVETFKKIRKDSGNFFRIQDIGIWLLIANTLREKYKGEASQLLKHFNNDASEIYNKLSNASTFKKDFPFLSGPKILPMWLKILWESGNVKLEGMEKIPLPVDRNVARITFNIIFQKEWNGKIDEKIRKEVSEKWKWIAAELKEKPIVFDTPLWYIGGNGCSKNVCNNCPVKKYCIRYGKKGI